MELEGPFLLQCRFSLFIFNFSIKRRNPNPSTIGMKLGFSGLSRNGVRPSFSLSNGRACRTASNTSFRQAACLMNEPSGARLPIRTAMLSSALMLRLYGRRLSSFVRFCYWKPYIESLRGHKRHIKRVRVP